MKFIIPFFVSIILLFIIKDIKSQNYQIDTNNTYEYLIKINKIMFMSDGNYYPLTIYLRPYGYWMPQDICFGHNYERSEYEILWIPEEKKDAKISTPKYIYDTLRFDTIMSYFAVNEQYIRIKTGNTINLPKRISLPYYQSEDTLYYLIKDFEYSFLLDKINGPRLSDSSNNHEFRVLYSNEVFPLIKTFNSIRISFIGDSAQVYFSLINVENLQQISLLKEDSTWLKPREVKQLKRKMLSIDFNVDGLDYCKGAYSEFLLEYKRDLNYYYCLLCDYPVNISGYKKEMMYKFSGLRNLLIHFSKKYF